MKQGKLGSSTTAMHCMKILLYNSDQVEKPKRSLTVSIWCIHLTCQVIEVFSHELAESSVEWQLCSRKKKGYEGAVGLVLLRGSVKMVRCASQ